jgi:hypothetical protein
MQTPCVQIAIFYLFLYFALAKNKPQTGTNTAKNYSINERLTGM